MKQFITIALLVLAGGMCNVALAVPPNNLPDPLQYIRTGAPVYGRLHTVPTATTSGAGYVGDDADLVTDAVTDLHLFQWGTNVLISCITNAATFCWVMDFDETYMTTSGLIVDSDSTANSGNDGIGSCFRVEPGTGVRRVTVLKDNFRATNKVGRRQDYCSGNATTVDWPCDSATDCGSGGACNTSSSDKSGAPFDRIRGAFLLSRAASAATCFITEEK